MKKVVIYGTGINCTTFLQYVHRRDFEIVAFVDMNKSGQQYMGMRILALREVLDLDYDEIFLTVNKQRDQIKKQLVEVLGVEISKIRDVIYLNKNYMLEGIENYRYVFFTDSQDYLDIPYSDILDRKDTTIRAVLATGQEWNLETFKSEKEIFFLFRSHCYRRHREEQFYQYIRAAFPASKQIFLLSDLCSGEFSYQNRIESFTIDYIKELFDLIITYHSVEAQQYGFVHREQVFSKIQIEVREEDTDVFFVGNAKNRLDKIHALYLCAKEHGLTCRFWIGDVKQEEMLPSCEDLIYNQRLTYMEYLKEMARCRCIVEICQKGDETTMRFAEAVVYNKKLLVDDTTCSNRNYFDKRYMQCFENVEDIDFEWVRQTEEVDYHYDGSFSPIHLLEYIENYF